jgi:2-polyprenyl-3-methyl-5-hydroxy-6-metoxy-1,4-benzoquinol methylase
MTIPIKSVPPDDYDQDFFQSCEGYSEFQNSQGNILPDRLRIPLEAIQINAGMKVVDVGCGRGEIIIHLANSGALAWGVDYSRTAVNIAQRTISETLTDDARHLAGVQQSSATALPFSAGCIDLVYMLDIVEHLNAFELTSALQEVFRVLKPGGCLVIHTMPNLWYYHHGYALYRWFQGLRGRTLPDDPHMRWKSIHMQTHVNEQTPLSLYRVVKSCGFHTKVWLQNTQNYKSEENKFVKLVMTLLANLYPFRFWFCNDIFAIATRPK